MYTILRYLGKHVIKTHPSKFDERNMCADYEIQIIEIQNTSCLCFVVANEFWQTSYNKTYETNVLQFAVNDEENPLCELFITNTYILVWIQLWA